MKLWAMTNKNFRITILARIVRIYLPEVTLKKRLCEKSSLKNVSDSFLNNKEKLFAAIVVPKRTDNLILAKPILKVQKGLLFGITLFIISSIRINVCC